MKRSIAVSALIATALAAASATAQKAPPPAKDAPKLDIKVHEPEPDDDDEQESKPPEGEEAKKPPEGEEAKKSPEGEEAKKPAGAPGDQPTEQPAKPAAGDKPSGEPRARPVKPDDDEPTGARPAHDEETDLVSGATPVEPDARSRWEEEHPRPDLPDLEPAPKLPWQRHGELGIDFAWVSRPFAKGLVDNAVQHYKAFPALGVHLHWALWRWLHVHPYFIWGPHPTDVTPGSLSTTSPSSISPATTFDGLKVQSFVFGAKLAPTWQINERWRAWFSFGVGYGRYGFKGMTATEPGGKPFAIPDRDGVFVELPIGIGASVDVVKRWLAVTYEASGAPIVGQSGQAHEATQAVDASGKTRDVGPFGAIQASFVQTIGLAIIL